MRSQIMLDQNPGVIRNGDNTASSSFSQISSSTSNKRDFRSEDNGIGSTTRQRLTAQ
jgi:hypothetical protein